MKRVLRRVLIVAGALLLFPIALHSPVANSSNPYPNAPQLYWWSVAGGTGVHTIFLSVQLPNTGTYNGTFEVFEGATIPSGTPTPVIELVLPSDDTNASGTLSALTSSDRFSIRYTPAGGASYELTTWTNREVKCAPGRFSASGNGPCTLASPGRYVAMPAATTEVECPAGSYQPSEGQMACLFAAPGYFVEAPGSTNQLPCQVGTVSTEAGQIVCEAVPPGRYADEPGSAVATPCAIGTYQPLGGQRQCVETEAGYYAPITGMELPLACLPGTYQPAEGQSECLVSPPGYKVSLPGSSATTACAIGTFAANERSVSCIPAIPGRYVAATGWSTSLACAAGTYQPNFGASSCLAADIGFFVAEVGATSQTPCNEGTTTRETGATQCVSSASSSTDPPPASITPPATTTLTIGQSITIQNLKGVIARNATINVTSSTRSICTIRKNRKGFTVTAIAEGTCRTRMIFQSRRLPSSASIPMSFIVQNK
jgi:hypothetical protein